MTPTFMSLEQYLVLVIVICQRFSFSKAIKILIFSSITKNAYLLLKYISVLVLVN